jgi:hypothetical protein
MRSNSGSGKGKNNLHDPTLKEHEAAVGIDGRAAHGGDVAPPNSDEAGRRQSPESGPPDQH